MGEFDWATLLAGILTAGATLAGFYFASVQIRLSTEQHRSAEAWRRTEFAARLMERLTIDDELAFCTRALDWGVGPLIIPAKHRTLFKNGEMIFDHDWNKLARALRPDLDWNWSDPELLTFRYSFDAFGSFLENLQRHISLNNIEFEHLERFAR